MGETKQWDKTVQSPWNQHFDRRRPFLDSFHYNDISFPVKRSHRGPESPTNNLARESQSGVKNLTGQSLPNWLRTSYFMKCFCFVLYCFRRVTRKEKRKTYLLVAYFGSNYKRPFFVSIVSWTYHELAP